MPSAVLVLLFLASVACPGEPGRGSGIVVTSLTAEQAEHVAVLGMVWGFLKYHHPRVAAGEFEWDGELFRILPEILEASCRDERNRVISQWADRLGVPESCARCANAPTDVHLLPPLDWMSDVDLLGAELVEQLEEIHRFRYSAREQAYVSKVLVTGNPVFDGELDYADQRPPDPGFRILALLRLWNIIEYWFPYRDQIEGDWHDVLHEMLPQFVAAADWDAYRLALLALLARVGDGHANLWAELDARPPCGDCYWPVVLRFVEGRLTVCGFTKAAHDLALAVEIGDVIETVDGRSVESLIEAWTPYYCASNEAARLRDIARFFPRGRCGESALAIVRDGKAQTVTVPRLAEGGLEWASHDRSGETFQLLSPEVAYLKLSSVRAEDVEEYVARAVGTRGLVIDIRNYPPEFVVFTLGGRLVREPTLFARFTVGDLDNPGAFTWMGAYALLPVEPGYRGKVAILVDEDSMSGAEYMAMALRASPDAVVVGSTTAGADGNVSRIPLPGGLWTYISGIGVFYADKTPTQRVGIVPDIFAVPTIDGIREGRDEVLEAALRHLLGPDADEDAIRRMAMRP